MRPTIALLACGVALAGCSDMNATQQRALSGTAIGAGGGAILGAIGGNAGLGAVAGAAAGLAGGLIYDSVKKNEQSAYQQGYVAGRHPPARHIEPRCEVLLRRHLSAATVPA